MQVTYQLTRQDLFDALIAHRNRSAVLNWALRLVVLIVLILVAGGLLVLTMRHDANTLSNLLPLFVFAGIWSLIVWGSPWLSARKQFSQQPSIQGLRTMSFDSAGVHWRWDGGSADLEWKNFIRLHETSKQVLLYSSPACFNVVPKRAFTPEELTEFHTLLAGNLANSKASSVN